MMSCCFGLPISIRSKQERFLGKIVFVAGYDITLAKRLVQGVDEICEKAERFCRQESDPPALPLPLCLSFRDAETFAVSYMDCPNAVTEGCIHGFVTDFTACLKQKPFKINID